MCKLSVDDYKRLGKEMLKENQNKEKNKQIIDNFEESGQPSETGCTGGVPCYWNDPRRRSTNKNSLQRM